MLSEIETVARSWAVGAGVHFLRAEPVRAGGDDRVLLWFACPGTDGERFWVDVTRPSGGREGGLALWLPRSLNDSWAHLRDQQERDVGRRGPASS